jgi:TatD DNase family protein
MRIDTHLHLQDISEISVRAEILSRAWDADLHQFWCMATRPEDWQAVEELAALDDRIIPFWGIHPWYAEKVKKGWDAELERFVKSRQAGIGEIGLDKVRPGNGLGKQIEVFRRQLEIASHLSLPVSIHCVQAWGDLVKILREHPPAPARLMIHSYHGSAETLRELVKLGAFISFSWKWLRGGTPDMTALVREVPDERLLLETDFPYTEPGRIGAGMNAEQYFECLAGVYKIAARARNVDEAALQEKVFQNGTAFLSGASAR